MSVGAICSRLIPIASTSTGVVAAAQCMQGLEERILVVIDDRVGKHQAQGIVTERELAGVIAREADPSRLALKDIMRADPGFVTDTADVFETACWMHRNGLREALVYDGTGRLTGIVTLDRLIDSLAGEIVTAAASSIETPAAAGRSAVH